CAVSKITRASYKHRSSRASKPFEELHLDLIGPISTVSYQGHRYILTIVDANTRFCSAIPIKAKSDVFSILTFAVDSEAKRFGNYPSIPTHRSNKSPYELFTGQAIPVDFFRPIGNPVAVYPYQKKSKLDPWGDTGKLIGFDAELKSYKVLMDDGRLINSKNAEKTSLRQEQENPKKREEPLIKEEDAENNIPDNDVSGDTQFEEAESADSDLNVAEILVPTASNPALQGRLHSSKWSSPCMA
ncbi:hypothetical protein VP01_5389g1, partial [Puccinia sorghi]